MTLDEPDHRLFVVTRAPARLVVFDMVSGKQVTALPCVQNPDDTYFDIRRKRIYIAGGEGFIDVFSNAISSPTTASHTSPRLSALAQPAISEKVTRDLKSSTRSYPRALTKLRKSCSIQCRTKHSTKSLFAHCSNHPTSCS